VIDAVHVNIGHRIGPSRSGVEWSAVVADTKV
jgi:hypothetical protein